MFDEQTSRNVGIMSLFIKHVQKQSSFLSCNATDSCSEAFGSYLEKVIPYPEVFRIFPSIMMIWHLQLDNAVFIL